MMFLTLLSLPFIAVLLICVLFGSQGGQRESRLHTFMADPPTMLIVGALAGLVGLFKPRGVRMTWQEFRTRRRIIDGLLIAFLVVFWTMEALTYFNVMGHPFKPGHTGNDFTWNGYLDFFMGPIVDTTVSTFHSIGFNLLALVLFLTQAWFLSLGRRLGYMFAFFNSPDNWSRKKN